MNPQNEWKDALNRFIRDYKKDKDVEAILLVGSYAVNNNNKYSDIDVYIVLKNRCNYRIRGNKKVGNYIIEYFINPIYKIEEYLLNDKRGHGGPMANMIINGKLIHGNRVVVERLKRKALNAYEKENEYDIMKYYRCWDAYEDYKACKYHNKMPYYICLKYLIEAYLYNNDYLILPENKIERFFKDPVYRKKYNVLKFPKNKFNKLVIKCFDYPNRNNLDNLYKYVIKDGKFNINNFKIKEQIKKGE
ncbi:MAG: nucleotidyltransferase domain-containing protein [Bacilli bacterium]|nr:nucleotidyltransferase domain-containing protein [Bacilli bacterium]